MDVFHNPRRGGGGGEGEPNSDEGLKPDSTEKFLSKLYTVMVLAPIDTCRILKRIFANSDIPKYNLVLVHMSKLYKNIESKINMFIF